MINMELYRCLFVTEIYSFPLFKYRTRGHHGHGAGRTGHRARAGNPKPNRTGIGHWGIGATLPFYPWQDGNRRLRWVQVRGLNNFRGHFFRPGHTCFGLRDRGGHRAVSAPGSAAARRLRPQRQIGGRIGEYFSFIFTAKNAASKGEVSVKTWRRNYLYTPTPGLGPHTQPH